MPATTSSVVSGESRQWSMRLQLSAVTDERAGKSRNRGHNRVVTRGCVRRSVRAWFLLQVIEVHGGASLEEIAVRHGHYPDGRSDAKGTEPEAIVYAKFGNEDYLFVATERGNFIAVYALDLLGRPRFKQLLPGPLGPEGLLAIPSRNLLVVSGEVDVSTDNDGVDDWSGETWFFTLSRFWELFTQEHVRVIRHTFLVGRLRWHNLLGFWRGALSAPRLLGARSGITRTGS
jgi:hypothetical protein